MIDQWLINYCTSIFSCFDHPKFDLLANLKQNKARPLASPTTKQP